MFHPDMRVSACMALVVPLAVILGYTGTTRSHHKPRSRVPGMRLRPQVIWPPSWPRPSATSDSLACTFPRADLWLVTRSITLKAIGDSQCRRTRLRPSRVGVGAPELPGRPVDDGRHGSTAPQPICPELD